MNKIKKYQLKKINPLIIKDETSVRFHVDNNDYFGTAATILKLLKKYLDQAIKKTPKEERVLINKTFKNLEKDLIILQNNYQIKANQKKGKTEVIGKLKSQ